MSIRHGVILAMLLALRGVGDRGLTADENSASALPAIVRSRLLEEESPLPH